MVVGICVDEGLVGGWTDGGGDMCRRRPGGWVDGWMCGVRYTVCVDQWRERGG